MPHCNDCGNDRVFSFDMNARVTREFHAKTGEEIHERVTELENPSDPTCGECGSNDVEMDA